MVSSGLGRAPMFAVALALGAAAVIGVAGCAATAPPGADAPEGAAAPATVAPHGPLLTSDAPITVVGTEAETTACFYGVLLSLPIRCRGLKLVGWDWNDHRGAYEEVAGRPGQHQGQFVLTGYLDEEAGTFTPVNVGSAEGYEPPEELPLEEQFATPCPEPAGGWRVVDEATTTEEALEAVARAAEKLRGYSALWLDSFAMADPKKKHPGNDPRRTIINVKVTHGIARAEKKLRKVWGGMLCVTTGTRTQAELLRIQDDISTKYQNLSSGPEMGEYLWVSTLYDDGTMQREFDHRYGAGAVRVSSQLRVVDPDTE